jgi:lipopolysaccharide/colanic/teichoic acid biosynthesis glycosyltransferase
VLNGDCRSASAPPPFIDAHSGLAANASSTSLQLRCEQFRQFSVAKRLFDVVVATATLAIFAPLLAVIALVIWLAIGAPILFRQQRPGRQGRPFTIYKFRTMTDARDAAGALLPDRERLGRVGKFLRITSLDELPELINVLRGEMSIVGPRPLLMEYLPRYSSEQMRRHDVLPGITGLAQINGRNAASWARKFGLDVWYVDHWSMWLDLKIIAVTVWKVLKREGINLSHHVSSEPFMGNAEAAKNDAPMIEREPTTVLVTGAGNTVGQPPVKAARPIALPCRIVDTGCDKLPVEKSEAKVIQMHGRRSDGAMQTLHTSDAAEWNDVLSKTRQRDFYHLPQYHRVAEQRGEGTAHLFVYSENGYTIALPLLLRPVDANEPEGLTDATSVYGYAGPVASHELPPESFLRSFQGALRDELSRARVVSVFSRLHPLIRQQEMLAGLGECVENGQTISIDLSLPGEEQRAHYKKDCRRRLHKLREAGFVCIRDRENRYLQEFVEVYHETMRRAGAQASYFFDRVYFEMLTRELDEVSHLFVVLKDHHVAAAVICTSCDGIVQVHLGGTRDAFLKFSPTRLAVDTVRVWAKENGARALHLGGGVGAQQDSLFEYKASFSDRRHTFFTWRWILQSDVYQELCSEKERGNTASLLQHVSAGYFPAYRYPVTPIEREGHFATTSAVRVTGKGDCVHE